MHVQAHFSESRKPILHDLIQKHPLATFIIYCDEIIIDHFPLVLDNVGEHGVLKGHVPRANDLWKALGNGQQAVAVFQGPEAYITPSWYPSKHKHGKAVPTWNYVVVHAHGVPLAVHNRDWLLAHLNQLTDQQESGRNPPWKVSDAPTDFTDKTLEMIVGIEMPISTLIGKWKVSQNRSPADRMEVAAGLKDRGASGDLDMEDMVMRAINNLSSQ
ncbi:MAG: FMN-binding negative transcriptional regulator [Candidatus Competibacteraceae bacterium]|jgi:transcriptional regulator|nr:FMN-binding negative transcriptional regulator [Candidatus Competibacteraceae bacterium]